MSIASQLDGDATALHASAPDSEERLEEEKGEVLRFAGDLVFACDPVPGATSLELVRFLTGEECRRLLLGAGGTRDVESLPESSALRRMWSAQASSGFAGDVPERGDEFLRTDTVVRFPGLALTNTVVNGFAVVDEGESSAECVSLLIGESRVTSGRRPLVWLFDKLTGDGRRQPEEYSQPKARVVSRTSVVATEDGTPAFRVDVRFRVSIEFPRTLLRLLPTSKENMESKGSAAIERAMSKDFGKAVEGVQKGFLECRSSS